MSGRHPGAVQHPPRTASPEIDDFGVLRHRGSWIALSDRHETIMRLLVSRLGRPVSRSDLAAVTWPDGGHSAHAMDVHIYQLRPRLAPMGLVIHTLRGRGFVLEPTTDDPATGRR